MILLDANLLLYAAIESFSEHEAARSWLDERMNGSTRVGLPWSSLLAFVRIATNPRVFDKPATVKRAWRQVADWVECSVAWVPGPTDAHFEILDRFMGGFVTNSKLVPDAHLAALAIEHGLTLCTTDGDFSRFPGLKVQNPLLRSLRK